MTLLQRLERHLAQLPPRVRSREQGKLLLEAHKTLEEWQYQRLMLAKLASDKAEFYNPLVVFEAKKIRDDILAERDALR